MMHIDISYLSSIRQLQTVYNIIMFWGLQLMDTRGFVLIAESRALTSTSEDSAEYSARGGRRWRKGWQVSVLLFLLYLRFSISLYCSTVSTLTTTYIISSGSQTGGFRLRFPNLWAP